MSNDDWQYDFVKEICANYESPGSLHFNLEVGLAHKRKKKWRVHFTALLHRGFCFPIMRITGGSCGQKSHSRQQHHICRAVPA